MKKSITIFVLLLILTQVIGQTSVTFQVNLGDLTKQRLFSDNLGDELCIRGSFNSWKGNDLRLKKSPNSDLYIGTFNLGNIGDTISYKFVIIKNQKFSFWESNPNPTNTDNGNRQLIIDKDSIVLPPAHFYYDEYFKYPVIFSEAKLKEDYLQFRNILETTHPALYDYTSKEVLDSIFDSNYDQITSDLEFSKFLILMTEVISKVGCGHSSLWVPGKFWNVAPEKLFPLKLVISNNKTFVKGDFDNSNEIPVGSEIISINDQPVHLIIKRLSSLTSADGFNSSYRQTKVAQNFSVKHAFAYGFPENFTVEFITPINKQKLEKSISPVSKETIDKSKKKHAELSFKQIEGVNAGLLTINTFGYYGEVEMFHNFIDSVFHEIHKQDIKNLILDLRGNGGGDPFCASYLWSYLQPEPLPYFEDHYGKYDTLANPIPKPKYNFKGELFTLIDGNGFSTTGHFCGLLKYHKVGTFIGSELGSTYTCTGNATYPRLKNTGIMVGTARVRRYTAAVKNMNPLKGVLPDYFIELTQNDIIAGRDAVMDFTLSLIKSKF
ncbi:MAG: S41 family peptidase [Ignavibacteriaceae bacterium]